MDYMKTLITTFIIGLLVTFSVLADTTEDVLAALDKAGIQYVYSTSGELRILKTAETADAVDAFVAGDTSGVDVEVVDLAETLAK